MSSYSVDCVSDSIMKNVDQETEKFHESQGDLQYICNKHDINDADCDKMQDYDIKHCFGDDSNYPIDVSASSIENKAESNFDNQEHVDHDGITATKYTTQRPEPMPVDHFPIIVSSFPCFSRHACRRNNASTSYAGWRDTFQRVETLLWVAWAWLHGLYTCEIGIQT